MSNIGIIGIGLIGSSLARDFMEQHAGTVHIYDRNPEHVQIARDLNLGHQFHETSSSIGAACEIIFICVPVRRIGDVAAELAPHLKPGTILTDVGSVKGSVVDDVRRAGLPEGIHFVPGHPAAGLEFSGPASGRAGLFKGKAYVFCPDAQTDDAATQAVENLIRKTGANILRLDAHKHDLIFSFTSHMAHVLAFAMMNATPKVSDHVGENILPYTGTSYRDLTRVANANDVMWRDIFLTNAKALEENLDVYLAEISHLRSMIADKDEDGLMRYIANSTRLREDMDTKYGAPGPSLPTQKS